jgi:hypothetical protein
MAPLLITLFLLLIKYNNKSYLSGSDYVVVYFYRFFQEIKPELIKMQAVTLQ